MTSLLRALGLALGGLVLSGCGAASLDDQVASLQESFNAGEFQVVVDQADGVLARCEEEGAGQSTSWRVEKLRLQAQAKLGRGDEVLAGLERLDEAYPGKVDAQLYGQVGQYVQSADLLSAIDVFDAGMNKFPEAEAFFEPQIASLEEAAKKAGDPEAIQKLKSLGYL